MTLMLATELLTRRRIIAGRGAITHNSQLCRGEQLKLPHPSIVSYPGREIRPV